MMSRPEEKLEYIPSYTHTSLADKFYETVRFGTDYEIINDINMEKAIRMTKKKK